MHEFEVATNRLTFQDVEEGHLASLVAAHEACFPGYFLTNLGAAFLNAYYRNYLESECGFGTVAIDTDGTVLAFATGTSDLSGQDARLVKRHFALIAASLLKGAVVSSALRRQLSERMARFAPVVRRLALGSGPAKAPAAANGKPRIPAVTLTSLGVLPDQRGSGLSSRTVEAFEEQVYGRGFRRVRVSTGLDNERAIAFYRKIGWTVEGVWPKQNRIDFERVARP